MIYLILIFMCLPMIWISSFFFFFFLCGNFHGSCLLFLVCRIVASFLGLSHVGLQEIFISALGQEEK